MVHVAILGFGTVGGGVAEVLTQNAAVLAQKVGQEINLKYILDTREFPGNPFESKLTHNFEDILNDPEVQVVAECIGGATIALEFVKSCWQRASMWLRPTRKWSPPTAMSCWRWPRPTT